MELFISICLGIGLSAATGFRVFVPALIANVATMNGWISPSDGFAWLGTWTAFIVLLSATVAEIAAFYIPFVDNLLDAVAVPVSVIAGTLLTTSFIEVDQPVLQWVLGIIVGGGTAGVVQAGTGLLRVFSSKMTAGVGNPVVSTTENVAAFGLSSLAVMVPVVAMLCAVFLLIRIVRGFRRFGGRRG
ncbi:DUF4126 domain-containing protein [Ravibacter arvi]|uniref:DUF4126 domain-containing protein n=1 Tax=Ravibacter arvi TaxID=2051041 RepID=A0ABP8M5P4_9BACT